MYEALTRVFLPLLKVEATQPEVPAGHETDEFLQTIRACSSYLQYKLFFWKIYALAWGLAVAMASAAVLAIDGRFVWLVIPVLLIAGSKAAALYVVTRLDYEMRWYVITSRSLLIRQGVWVVREITLTFANAQNVRVQQGPLQRWFGFSDVEVDTAGGAGHKNGKGIQPHRAVLRGLSNPEQVRTLILELLRRHRTAGLGDPDDARDSSAPSQVLKPQILNEILVEARALKKSLQSNQSGMRSTPAASDLIDNEESSRHR